MIHFSCSSCGAKFKVSDDKGGKTGKCTQCGSVLNIPVQIVPSVDVIGDVRRIPDLPSMPAQEPSSSSAPSLKKPPLPPVPDSDDESDAELEAWRKKFYAKKQKQRAEEGRNAAEKDPEVPVGVKLVVGGVVGILVLLWMFSCGSGTSGPPSYEDVCQAIEFDVAFSVAYQLMVDTDEVSARATNAKFTEIDSDTFNATADVTVRAGQHYRSFSWSGKVKRSSSGWSADGN